MAYKVDEMWWNMAQWLRKGAIPDEQEIEDDLVGREYGYTTDNAIRLEKKDDMKKRGLASPDNADALALTFAYAVAPRVAEMEQSERAQRRHMRSRDRATGY
jgi:phage terminase large subunit